MKILYSQIKELIPNLKASPEEVANVLTLTGFMRDGFEQVQYQNKKDYLISLEVRQNRADCLSIIGLAKEISAYYGLKIKLPDISLPPVSSLRKPNIKIDTNNNITRVLAVEIKGLKNKKSPEWLKEFLSFYGINQVNLLVDLSNYVMLLTGYPSHLLDTDKINGSLYWSLNNFFKEITTLDNSNVKLKRGELIIRDDENILALAGIIGGRTAKIEANTKSIIAEMAIYSPLAIRNDSRNLKIVTDASQRLSKDLDPNGLEFAMNFLIFIILKNCDGNVESKIFDYYPNKYFPPEIEFDPSCPSVFAGVDIPKEKSIEILKRLYFKIRTVSRKLMVTPPTNRKDVFLQKDLVEEVIRIFGYDKIPYNELPKLEVVKGITPKNVYLGEKIKDVFSTFGFDEILSWPLTKKGDNTEVNYLDWDIVSTQNSVNEDYTELRQSMAVGLRIQLQEYLKKNIGYIKIFEIGKVFGKRKSNYEEYETIGILMYTPSNEKSLPAMRETVEKLLRTIGFLDIAYVESKTKPQIANPYSCWDIIIKKKVIGIFYKLDSQKLNQNTYFAELNLNNMAQLLEGLHAKSTIELKQKLVVLDTNIELKKDEKIDEFIANAKEVIKNKNIWSIVIIDKFPLEEKIKYTVRISYKNLTDQEAKKIHSKAFNLQ